MKRSATNRGAGTLAIAPLPPFDPLDPAFADGRYEIYARYRNREPVHWGGPTRPGAHGQWFLFRHADVAASLTDPRLGKEHPDRRATAPDGSAAGGYASSGAMINDWLMFRDPPYHTRMRSLVSRAFTAPMVEKQARRIEAIADELLEHVEADGRMDLVSQFAFPFTASVIAELIGFPFEEREDLRCWAKALADVIDVAQKPAAREHADRAVNAMWVRFQALFAERRREPRADLVSKLLQVDPDGVDPGAEIDDRSLFATCVMLVTAGHETTSDLVGTGVLALLQNPHQLHRLRGDPTLDANAVEECLRHDCPVQITSRMAGEDLEIGGRRIARGERIQLVLGSANRDPLVFSEPDRFRIDRDCTHSLGLGKGSHYCLGAPLARLEARIGLRRLLDRFADLRLESGLAEWRDNAVFRGLVRLPVAWN